MHTVRKYKTNEDFLDPKKGFVFLKVKIPFKISDPTLLTLMLVPQQNTQSRHCWYY